MAKSNVISMQEFLSDDIGKIEYAKVEIEDGKFLALGSVSIGEYTTWQEANEDAKATAGIRLIIRSLVDGVPGEDDGATGQRIGNDAMIPALRKKPLKMTEKILGAIVKLNGMPGSKGRKDDAKND